MEIKDVQLNHTPAQTEPKDKNGLAQPTHDDLYSFVVTTTNDEVLNVPNDPKNRDYQAVAAWYKRQDSKPFKFKFAK